jgi:hypothetical protein
VCDQKEGNFNAMNTLNLAGKKLARFVNKQNKTYICEYSALGLDVHRV